MCSCSCAVCVCVCGGGGGGGQLAVVSVLIDEYKVKLSVLIHLGILYFTVLAGMSLQ